jgi:hypothetical protein
MRASQAFVLGTFVGAAAVWLWGRQMEEYVGEKTRGVRTKAADLLQGTKEHVSEAFQAGQEAIRPAPVARKA